MQKIANKSKLADKNGSWSHINKGFPWPVHAPVEAKCANCIFLWFLPVFSLHRQSTLGRFDFLVVYIYSCSEETESTADFSFGNHLASTEELKQKLIHSHLRHLAHNVSVRSNMQVFLRRERTNERENRVAAYGALRHHPI